jgi:hypothetical protein
VELFLLPLHEAKSLPSGDDHCVGLHRSTVRKPLTLPLSPRGRGMG